MANTKKEKIDLTYTQIIDPTLGGNLPKPKATKKSSPKTKATGTKKSSATTTKASNKKKSTSSVVKKNTTKPTSSASAAKKAVVKKTSEVSAEKSKSSSVKKTTSPKPKMKYDDLTYTQIIDPTLGGNLPGSKKEPIKESPKKEEKEDLTYTQMLDLGTKVNVKEKKEIEPEVELFEDEESSLSVVIASILVLALIVIGIIIASHLIK